MSLPESLLRFATTANPPMMKNCKIATHSSIERTTFGLRFGVGCASAGCRDDGYGRAKVLREDRPSFVQLISEALRLALPLHSAIHAWKVC